MAEVTLGELGSRFKEVRFTLLVSTDGVPVVLSGGSGLRGAGGRGD